jgi:hypothetical protein
VRRANRKAHVFFVVQASRRRFSINQNSILLYGTEPKIKIPQDFPSR